LELKTADADADADIDAHFSNPGNSQPFMRGILPS